MKNYLVELSNHSKEPNKLWIHFLGQGEIRWKLNGKPLKSHTVILDPSSLCTYTIHLRTAFTKSRCSFPKGSCTAWRKSEAQGTQGKDSGEQTVWATPINSPSCQHEYFKSKLCKWPQFRPNVPLVDRERDKYCSNITFLHSIFTFHSRWWGNDKWHDWPIIIERQLASIWIHTENQNVGSQK